ncbi:hypothetical protein PsYK624_086560 [Phanerochaete sordida]|uniref:Uncharacterized protein n=1 Tax=Phanerochaete sordida TaxID=48140 RepID=A0A9P3LFY0_9APHY|nr:hypothetical protein PsYK624_086560 [Phanerochaete sordida]
MAQFTEAFAGATRVVFGPANMDIAGGDAPPSPFSASEESVKASTAVIDATRAQTLHIIVYSGTPHAAALRHVDLARNRTLRALKIEVVYDTLDGSRIIDVWRSILAVLRSITEATALECLTLTSPVPLASLRAGWSRSALVAALRQPLYSIDHCLVGIVDSAPVEYVVVVAPQGETFLSTDWARARSLLPALYDYGMLRH